MSPCPEELISLTAYWTAQRDSRGALPARAAFAPEHLRPWLGNIGIVAVEREAKGLRFRVVLSGTRLDEYRGHSITGRYIDEACHNIAATTPHYQTCVDTGMPVHFLHDNSPNSAIYKAMGKLLLPLSEDGITVDRILVAIYPLQATNDMSDAIGSYALAG